MNSLNRLLTSIKSLFTKRGNNVENIENTAEVLPAADLTPETTGAQSGPGPAISADASAPVPAAAGSTTVPPSVPAAAVTTPEPITANAGPAVVSGGLLSDVKTLLKVAGHDVEAVWDDAVAYAQKVAQEEAELADKLVSVLHVAGHDVAEIIGDAFSFARKHGKS